MVWIFVRCLEERQHVVVEDLDRRQGQLAGVEPGPDVPAVAVEHGLEVDPPDPLQGPGEEGVHGHQLPRVGRLDVALPELGAVALQEPDLLVGERQPLLPHRRLEPQEPLVAGHQVMPGCSITSLTRLGCGPRAPGSRSIRPSEP